MQALNASGAPAAVGPYSHAIRTGNLLFCSGQIPLVPETMHVVEGGIEAQTQQVFTNITAVLSEAGLCLSNVVKATVFLESMDDFKTVNGIYAEAFGAHKPARSAVEVSKLPLGVLVEIEVIAEFGSDADVF